jgi:hypothetical protein
MPLPRAALVGRIAGTYPEVDMTERTAEQAHKDAQTDISFWLDEISLKTHYLVDRAGDSPNWGDVGDLNAIAEALREIAEGK